MDLDFLRLYLLVTSGLFFSFQKMCSVFPAQWGAFVNSYLQVTAETLNGIHSCLFLFCLFFGSATQSLTHSSTEATLFGIKTFSYSLFKWKAVLHNPFLIPSLLSSDVVVSGS